MGPDVCKVVRQCAAWVVVDCEEQRDRGWSCGFDLHLPVGGCQSEHLVLSFWGLSRDVLMYLQQGVLDDAGGSVKIVALFTRVLDVGQFVLVDDILAENIAQLCGEYASAVRCLWCEGGQEGECVLVQLAPVFCEIGCPFDELASP